MIATKLTDKTNIFHHTSFSFVFSAVLEFLTGPPQARNGDDERWMHPRHASPQVPGQKFQDQGRKYFILKRWEPDHWPTIDERENLQLRLVAVIAQLVRAPTSDLKNAGSTPALFDFFPGPLLLPYFLFQ